jgi:hypothetical protein
LTRILLIARTGSAWPAAGGALANHEAVTSGQALGPLPSGDGHRMDMFTVARDSFAARYGIDAPTAIGPLERLDDDPELGLTLAVHMAALVAVNAQVAGRQPPADVAGLTMLPAGPGTPALASAARRLYP